MERKSSKDQQTPEFIKVLSLGDVGTGKSSFAATFPAPMYVFNLDSKMGAYKDCDAAYIDIPNTGEGWTILEKEKQAVKKEVEEGKYKTIVVDSTTALQKICLDRAMQLDPKRDKDGGPIWNVHHKMKTNFMDGFLRQVISFCNNCNLVIITHYGKVTDSNGSVVGFEPFLAGQLSITIPSLFDEIYIHQYKSKNNKPCYIMSTVPQGLYKAARSSLRGKDLAKPTEIDNTYQSLIKTYSN